MEASVIQMASSKLLLFKCNPEALKHEGQGRTCAEKRDWKKCMKIEITLCQGTICLKQRTLTNGSKAGDMDLLSLLAGQ